MPTKTVPPCLTNAAKNLAAEASDPSTLSNGAKAARSIIQIRNAVSPWTPAQPSVKGLSFAVDFFKAMGFVTWPKDLTVALATEIKGDPKEQKRKTVERDLRVASAAMKGFVGGLTCLKIADSVGAVKLSQISQSLGKLPVIGAAALAFPFGSFTNVLDITKGALDIAIAATKIKGFNRQQQKTREKNKLWENAPVTQKFAAERVEHIKAKIQSTTRKVDTLKTTLAAPKEAVKKAKRSFRAEELKFIEAKEKRKKLNPFTRFCKLCEWHKLKKSVNKARHRLEKTQTELASTEGKVKAEEKKIGDLQKKVEGWTKVAEVIGQVNLSNDAKADLTSFQEAKARKWNVKTINLGWSKAKEGLTIGFQSVVIVALLGMIILTALNVLSILAISLTVSSVFLFISAYALGLSLFKKYHQPKAPKPVALPQLA